MLLLRAVLVLMATMKEVAQACDELKREIRSERDSRDSFERELRRELRDIKNSLNFMNQKYEEAMGKIKLVMEENRDIKKNNETLLAKCQELAERVSSQEMRLVQCEQYSRKNNIEVKGVPTAANENILSILGKLGEQIGVPINPDDVEIAHRVPVPNNPTHKNIVVQFVHRMKRNVVLEKSRQKRITSKDLDFATSCPIYVNEHLCPELKRLLGQAVSHKKDANWKFAWVRNGQVLARRTETSPVVKISSVADLAKICRS